MRRFTVIAFGLVGCGLVYDYGDYAGSGSGGGDPTGTSSSTSAATSSGGGSGTTSTTSAGGGSSSATSSVGGGGSSAESTASAGGGGSSAESTTSSAGGGGSSAESSVSSGVSSGGEGGEATNTSSTGGDGGGGSPPLGCVEQGNACFRRPPGGWFGPFAVSIAAFGNAATCDPSYPSSVGQGNGGLVGSPASCGCTCGAANVVCPNGTAALGRDESPDICSDFFAACRTPFSLAPNTCTVVPWPGAGCGDNTAIDSFTVGAPTSAACEATPSSSIPPWSWTLSANVCSAPVQEGECDVAEVCLPTPPDQLRDVCVARMDGDFACALPYSAKTLLFAGVSDTRACTSCSCNPAVGASCNGTLSLASGGDGDPCPANAPTSIAVPMVDCQVVPTYGLARYSVTPSGSCSPPQGAGQPTGSVQGTEPTTLCCLP